MGRQCYTKPESDWIDTVCLAMNRWAMSQTEIEAEVAATSSETVGLTIDAASSPPLSLDSALFAAHRANRGAAANVSDRTGMSASI